MKLKTLVIVFCVLVGLSFKSDIRHDSEISEVLNQYLSDENNPGIAVAIISEGKESFYCEGFSDVKGGRKIDTESIFEIGSITKVFTNILLAKEVSAKRLALDESIFGQLPGINKGQDITFRQLATHSSGLPRMADNFWESTKDKLNPYADYSEKELYSYMSNYKLNTEPGTSYAYSNVGAALLGNILCHLSKDNYNSMVTRTICKPWGMINTTTNPDNLQQKHLALGHSKGEIVPSWFFQDATAGQGALRSDIKDMMKFMKANLYPEKLALKDAVIMAQEAHFADGNKRRTVGLGWHIGTLNSNKYLEHTGGTGGYRSYIGLVPGTKTGVVILSNSDNDVTKLGVRILKIFNQNEHVDNPLISKGRNI